MQVVELIERRFDLPLALGKRLDARHNRPGKDAPHLFSICGAEHGYKGNGEATIGYVVDQYSESHKNDRQSFPLVILCRFQRKSDIGRATLVHLVHSIGLWIHSLHSP
jgi:hypothetical protein